MKQTLIRMYGALLCILFGIAFSAQLLGFFGWYTAPIAIPITLLIIIFAYLTYQRFGISWFETLAPQEPKSSLLQNVIITACLIIVGIVFIQRMILWHQSSLGTMISVDFANYHSIKAYELLYSGSAWNLAIPYGQYPFGYESLIAFGMFFTHDVRITGTIHALIFLLLWLTIALLIIRYSDLSIDLSLLIALVLCFMPMIFPQILNLGKNDILLSVTVLIAILHAPVGDSCFHPIGLAFATMLSLATKATGLYILFYLWGLLMLNWGLHLRDNTWRDYLHPFTFMLTIVLMFPGGLWVIRNYLVLGKLFTSEIDSFFQTSIFVNLDNPALYDAPNSDSLGLALSIVIILALLSIFHKKLGWQMAGTILIIALTFAITPLSAFLTVNNLNYLDVQWRFVLHGIVIFWVIGIVFFAPLIRPIYDMMSSQRILKALTSIGVIVASFALIFILGVEDIFGQDADQWERIIDPTLQDNSIYDEMANLDAAIIYIENVSWLATIINNPDLTITELRYPLGQAEVYPVPDVEYIAFVPGIFDEPTVDIYREWDWEVIFEHESGRIYRRIR